jgi:hypothetical protein
VADNRWLREAFENRVLIIFFLYRARPLSGHASDVVYLQLGRQAIESMRRVWGARSGISVAARIAGRQRSRSGKKVIERI